MPGAPRAASASPSEPALGARRSWRKQQRLLRASEFAFVSSSAAAWRVSRRWLALRVHISAPRSASGASPPFPVRFGFTIARRQVRRAVARNAIKRVLREAFRGAYPQIAAAAGGREVDVLVRVRAGFPDPTGSTWRAAKASLREEADRLVVQLRAHLALGERQDRGPGMAQSDALAGFAGGSNAGSGS